MSLTWTIGRVGLALLPAALLGLGLAGPAAADYPPLYFANTGGHEIGVATGLTIGEFDATSDQNAIDTVGYTDGLAVYGQQIYWSNDEAFSGAGAIGVASLDSNGNPIASSVNTDLIPFDGNAEGIAVNRSHIYWTDQPAHAIDVANRDGSDATTLISGIPDPLGIAVDAQHIYWSNGGTGASGTGTIGEANLDGSGANPSFITDLNLPGALSLDDAGIYWLETNQGAIGAGNLDGGGVNAEAYTGFNTPASVAVEGGALFWGDVTDRTIGVESLDKTQYDQNLLTGLPDPEAMAFATPEATVSPASLNGATPPQTTYGPMVVTVTNAGLANLDVEGSSIGGADPGDFSIAFTTCFSSVPFGVNGTCEVGIDYTPQEAQGDSSATLEINSNDLIDGPLYVPLSGTVQVAGATTTTPVTATGTTPTNTTPPVIPPPPPLPVASGGGVNRGGGVGVAAIVTTPGLKRITTVSTRGVVRLPLSCSRARRCTGEVTLTTRIFEQRGRRVMGHAKRSTRTVTLGRTHYTLAAGAKSHVAVHLSSTGLKLLKAAKGRRLNVSAVIAAGGRDLRRSLTLVAPASRLPER